MNGELFQNIAKTPRKLAILVVRVYQKTISPDHGLISYKHPYGFCKHSPTCSEYTCQALEKYGLVRGGVKSIWRILRCNPYSRGGFDPLI